MVIGSVEYEKHLKDMETGEHDTVPQQCEREYVYYEFFTLIQSCQ